MAIQKYFRLHEIFPLACGYLRNNEVDVNLLLAIMPVQKQHRQHHNYEVTIHRVNKSGRIRSKLLNHLLALLYNSRDRLVILLKFESELVWFPDQEKRQSPQGRLLALISATEVRQETTVCRKKCSIGEAQ